MKKILLISLLYCCLPEAFCLKITIVESQSYNSGQIMDDKWKTLVTGMGHTANIVQQSTLDSNLFFPSTDMLIISSGVISLSAKRIYTILQFVKSGKPVYIQSEYQRTYNTNQAFEYIVSKLGGSFQWKTDFSGDLKGMKVLGTFATTKKSVSPLSYYWYSVSGSGGCNIINYLESGGEYHGFQFVPSNTAYGSVSTNTDQDWVNQSISTPLMENIITHLISPLNIQNNGKFSLGKDTAICQGDTLKLKIESAAYTCLWSDGSTKNTFNATKKGKVWVKVTGGCINMSDTIMVDLIPKPKVNLGNDTTLCENSQLILKTNSASANFTWQDNSTQNQFLVVQKGKYWVRVHNSCGVSSDTIIINYAPRPTVNLGPDTVLCQGQTMTLNASFPKAGYQWQDFSSSPVYILNKQGLYIVQVFNECDVAIDSIRVNYISTPVVNLGKDSILCPGNILTLNVTTPNATYQWQDNSTQPTFIVSQTGMYWVKVANACGEARDTINLTYDELIWAHLGNDTVLCPGQFATLRANTNANQYWWQDGNTDPTYSVSKPGLYWIASNNHCGTTYDSIQVTYDPIPSVKLGTDTILCAGEKLKLNVFLPHAKYQWNDNSANPELTISQKGIYWVTVSNTCGSAIDTIHIDLKNCLCEVYIPTSFSPNEDHLNDKFSTVASCSISDFHMIIYNRWGIKIFETISPIEGWNGTYLGKFEPDGVYVYSINFDLKGSTFAKRGTVTLLR